MQREGGKRLQEKEGEVRRKRGEGGRMFRFYLLLGICNLGQIFILKSRVPFDCTGKISCYTYICSFKFYVCEMIVFEYPLVSVLYV